MFEGFKFDRHSDRPGSRGDGDDPKKVDPSKQGKSEVTVNELPLASPFSINETPRLEEPKRSLSLSISLSDVFRRGSQASSKSRSSSPVRKESVASSLKSHYLRSHNPDIDSDFPARSGSVASATSNTDHSPEGSRKPSYVPKNASNSFMKTATAAQTAEEKGRLLSQSSNNDSHTAQRQQSVFSAGSGGPSLAMSMTINNSVPRQPSIAMSTTSNGRNHSLALSDSSDVSSSTFSNGRRPSGVIPGNIASRYMRTASLTSPDEEGGEPSSSGRRRSSNKSRQGSGGTVKPVQMAPDTYMQWQNSVSKAMAVNGVGYTKPGDSGRLQSLGGIADLTEEADEDAPRPKKSSRGKNPSFSMAVQPPSPARTSRSSKKFSIDTDKANTSEADATRMDSGRTPSLISPTNVSFGMVDRTGKPKMTRTVSGGAREVSNSELESLGFHGAVPA